MPPPPNSFSPEQRKQLLQFARRSIEAAVRNSTLPTEPAEFSGMEGCGVFVSLHIQGRLRGCIGMVESNLGLAATLARCARNAALEDSRFQPLQEAELDRVAIEISVLSPLLSVTPEQVEPGVHGLLIRKSGFSGLLLPQVAQRYNWPREKFLEETCAKAGLPRTAWREPDTRILAFTAEVFSE